MLKKIDELILKAFYGPFVLTFLVVEFIFLLNILLKYFPELVGKGLGIDVFVQLFFYFSINASPISLPLAMLLSSLIAYGNLGEHFELTAIKASGISLIRTLIPILIVAVVLCFVAFYINNNIVPKANLKAFSLLYDARHKKPTLDFKEGSFYYDIPGYAIKINKKSEDGNGMKGVIIYNHTANRGNIEVILADSGRMYTMMKGRYLVMDLFEGKSYSELIENQTPTSQQYFRNDFDSSRFVFSLESFDLQRTQEDLFAGHRVMRNIDELNADVDSLHRRKDKAEHETIDNINYYYSFQKLGDTSRYMQKYTRKYDYNADTVLKAGVLRLAANNARNVKTFINSQKEKIDWLKKDANNYMIERWKKFTFSFACLVMFVIGAPLGAIIKKGGLGLPTLVAILFFIIYYVINIVMEKWCKEGIVDLTLGIWAANLIFLPIGLFFLRQAQNDSRVFEADYFRVMWDKIIQKLKQKKSL